MRKLALVKLLPLVLALSPLASVAVANDHDHHHMMNHAQAENVMSYMHKNMMAVEPVYSDNLEYNFIYNMIPHHQDAIDSSKYFLKLSQDHQVRKIARNIIKTQEQEVKYFNKLLPSLKKNKVKRNKAQINRFNADAKDMMATMHKDMAAVELSNIIERDFLVGMLAHHQGAVDASKQILQYTKNRKIKKIARDIISAQEREIAEFKAIIKRIDDNNAHMHHHH